jgi:signal transduction histidine kinase/ActR/RegA family two-component response regulator
VVADTRALLETLDIGVVMIAPDWTIAEWNAPAAHITGIPADRMLGQNFWVAFPTARTNGLDHVLDDVLQDGVPRSFVAPGQGTDLRGMVFDARLTGGPRNHLLLLFRERTAEVEQDSDAGHVLTAVETDRRLYKQLFTQLPTPALVLTVDGQIIDANPEAAALLGVPNAPALRGRTLADWAMPDQRVAFAKALRDAVTRRQAFRLSLEFAGESAREVEAVIQNLDPTDSAAKLLFFATDVSREVLLQQKLLKADRLAQLGALVSGVAHELNNPLAAIAAFAELLATGGPEADLKESGQIIHMEAMRAGRMVQTLLDFARQRARVRQPVDLLEVVERVLALQRNALKKARVKVEVTMPADLPDVTGDPQELQQVVLNAVVNAQQAIEETGRPGKLSVCARRVDEHVALAFEDTGPGVPPELLNRIFEPFFTTKGEAGTGLGLSISFGIVKAMGGRMYMHNLEGGGARLSVELPTVTAPAVVEERAGFHRATRPLSVLVVEDEGSVRRGMELMAERLGHRVTSAGGFDDALRHLADHERYDALLVDVHLDEAHTGFDLFETLRLEGRGLDHRVVFTTGDSMSARTRDALQRSERPVLRKPFDLEELRGMLDRVAGE